MATILTNKKMEQLGVRPDLFQKYQVKLPKVIFRQKTYDEVISKNRKLADKNQKAEPVRKNLKLVEETLSSVYAAWEKMDDALLVVEFTNKSGSYPSTNAERLEGNLEGIERIIKNALDAINQAEPEQKSAAIEDASMQLNKVDGYLFWLNREVKQASVYFEAGQINFNLNAFGRIRNSLGKVYNCLRQEERTLTKWLSDNYLL